MPLETDELLTEHPLETFHNEDLPVEQRNVKEKSFILGPFSSLLNPDDTLEDLIIDFEPKAIKFDRKVKDINRQYEDNNNEDLDNGVINQAL